MNTAPHSPRRLLYRWFVQFNPMFTASALCVLGGVLLLSRALGAGSERALTVVVELYQWLLIGVAGLLYRRLLERRPAAILGVIAVVFAMDPTLQVSSLAAAEDSLATVLWLGGFALKLRGILWAFRLTATRATQGLPMLGAVLVAFLATERVVGVDESVLRIVMTCGTFALIALARLGAVGVSSTSALDDYATMMFHRLVKAAAGIGVVGAALQMVNASLQLGGLVFFPVVGAALLASALATRDERALWTRVVAAFVVCAIDPTMLTATLPLFSVALLAQPHLAPRAQVAGVMTAVTWCGLVSHTAVPPTSAIVVGSLALVALLVRRRAWSAAPALVVLNKVWLVDATDALGDAARVLAPSTGRGWGFVLVAAGFVLLPVGVVVHRRLSRSLADLARADDATEALRACADELHPLPSSPVQALSSRVQGTTAVA